MRKVSIVNKFGPLSTAITGNNAKELAEFLHANDIEVTYNCLSSTYRSKDINEEKRDLGFKVTELSDYYKGSSAILRFFWGFIDGFRLWLATIKQKADVVIVMTDPPLLFFWFQLFRRFSKRQIFYWTMDLYPDAFVAGNYIKPGNIFFKLINAIMYKRAPDYIIALGEKQLKFLEKKFNGIVPNVVIPCGVIEKNEIRANQINQNDKITFGYGGNVGEAHDATFLISLINELNPEKHRMILSMYGSKAEYVKQRIHNNRVVQFKSFLNYADIASIDVNVATLLPEWDHICAPSKAVTAICCGSSLLLNASKETDAWNMFKEASWLVESGRNYETEIKNTIEIITKDKILNKKLMAVEISRILVEKKIEALQALVFAIKNSLQTC